MTSWSWRAGESLLALMQRSLLPFGVWWGRTDRVAWWRWRGKGWEAGWRRDYRSWN